MRSPTKSLIVRYLDENGPLPSDDLADLLGITRRSVNRALADMVALPTDTRPAHIERWDQVERGLYGAVPVAVYAAGPGPNRRKPKAKTKAQCARERRARLASAAGVVTALARTSRNGAAHADESSR